MKNCNSNLKKKIEFYMMPNSSINMSNIYIPTASEQTIGDHEFYSLSIPPQNDQLERKILNFLINRFQDRFDFNFHKSNIRSLLKVRGEPLECFLFRLTVLVKSGLKEIEQETLGIQTTFRKYLNQEAIARFNEYAPSAVREAILRSNIKQLEDIESLLQEEKFQMISRVPAIEIPYHYQYKYGTKYPSMSLFPSDFIFDTIYNFNNSPKRLISPQKPQIAILPPEQDYHLIVTPMAMLDVSSSASHKTENLSNLQLLSSIQNVSPGSSEKSAYDICQIQQITTISTAEPRQSENLSALTRRNPQGTNLEVPGKTPVLERDKTAKKPLFLEVPGRTPTPSIHEEASQAGTPVGTSNNRNSTVDKSPENSLTHSSMERNEEHKILLQLPVVREETNINDPKDPPILTDSPSTLSAEFSTTAEGSQSKEDPTNKKDLSTENKITNSFDDLHQTLEFVQLLDESRQITGAMTPEEPPSEFLTENYTHPPGVKNEIKIHSPSSNNPSRCLRTPAKSQGQSWFSSHPHESNFTEDSSTQDQTLEIIQAVKGDSTFSKRHIMGAEPTKQTADSINKNFKVRQRVKTTRVKFKRSIFILNALSKCLKKKFQSALRGPSFLN